jgi:hypothetical protein
LARWSTLLLCMFLWGCSGATPFIRHTSVQQERCVSLSLHQLGPKGRDEALTSAKSDVRIVRVAAPAGALPATPVPPPSSPPLRALPGGALGNGIPQGVLRFAPAGGTAAAAEAAPAAGKFVFLGGAFIAATGSIVLVCVTVDAAVSGEETPIETADNYYGTHFGDLVGWVQGQYPTAYRTKIRPKDPKANPEPATNLSADPLAELSREPDDDEKVRLGRIYVTYTRFNEKTRLTYSGRTSMIIDLSKDHRLQAALAVAMRDKNHHVEDQEAEPNS